MSSTPAVSLVRVVRHSVGPHSRAAVLLVVPAVVAALVTCTDSGSPTAAGEADHPAAAIAAAGAETRGVGVLGTIPLPINQTVATTAPALAFLIRQTGTGPNAQFAINNSTNRSDALAALNFALGRAGVFFLASAANDSAALFAQTNGKGSAGKFFIGNRNNTSAALSARTDGNGQAGEFISNRGTGDALSATSFGTGHAGSFFLRSTGDPNAALFVQTFGTGPAGEFRTLGTGNALLVNYLGSCASSTTVCNLAVFQNLGTNEIRFNRAGKGFFNGGTQNSGADVAEAFEVEGTRSAYEPGDVLVISERGARRVEKSSEPYSTRVAGVHATKPGVLLTEKEIDDSLEGMVPLGVVGVIPTKVSAEGGAIHRGDLLVTSSTPGHAMRADPDRLRVGMSLGKALDEFSGPGTGVIPVLVTLR